MPFKAGKKLPFLYLITNRKLCYPKPLEEVVLNALEAGVRFVQLREKDMTSCDLALLAKKIKILAEKYGAYLIINGSVDIALDVDAEGVHLPETSQSALEARKLLGPGKIIGKSAHLPLSLKDEDFKYIDFITMSPVFNPGKKDYKPNTIGAQGLKKAISTVPVPVYALGGIQPDKVAGLKEAGSSGIAVSSGILLEPDVKRKIKEYLTAWQR